MINFAELLERRRSIRDFQQRDVPLDLIKEIITDSCLAPSSGNGQPWRFVIITNGAFIERISDESKTNLLAGMENDPQSPTRKYEKILRNPDFNVFYNAPCLVLIAGPEDLGSVHVDCALAACYFMFAATARGLGTCWIGLGADIRSPDLRQAMGLSDADRIVAPIIVGYPKQIPGLPARKEPRILKVIT